MNDYYHVRFNLSPCTETECDILSALLCEVGFESFVPDEKGVSAYIKSDNYQRECINTVLAEYPFVARISMDEELIEGEDWNKEWEKNYFKPIVFKGKCVIHSSFHHDYPNVEYDIVIDPRMAFGTGHHETTSLMIERMLSSDLKGKRLLDMGTGTGVLAILASMCGAASAVGVEIDPPAYENAVDNVRLNQVNGVEIRLGGIETVVESQWFDFVLANINRNIILNDIAAYANALKVKGSMILSGFYKEDIPMIEEKAAQHGLCLVSVLEKNRWVNMLLTKI